MKKRLLTGFTLVEILVVIAILAVLAALVVGGTGLASASAKAVRTANNMREINTALTQIAQDGVNTGYHPTSNYPPYRGVDLDPEEPTQFLWWDLVGAELGFAEARKGRYIWNVHPKETPLQNPLSRKKIGGSGKKQSNQVIRRKPQYTGGSFAINSWISVFINEETEGERRAVRTDEIEDPENTIFFAESDDNLKGGKRSVGWAFFNPKNAPQGNHKDSVHCMFMSGAVKLIPNKDLKNPKKLKFYMTVDEKDYSLRQ